MRVGLAPNKRSAPRNRSSAGAATLSLILATAAARAAPEEIHVYLDDLTAPGRFGLDLHNNFTIRGRTNPDYVGARRSDHVYRLTPEFYFGLTPTLELGAYVLTALDRDCSAQLDGEKVRIKYVAPHDGNDGMFWGANLEVGRTSLAVAERPWNYELKAIGGRHFGPWMLAFNLNLDAPLSARLGPATLDLDTRLTFRAAHHTRVGIESYDELGPIGQVGALHGRGQLLYAVVDTEFADFDLSAGVGRGLTRASDGWVVKAIFGFHF